MWYNCVYITLFFLIKNNAFQDHITCTNINFHTDNVYVIHIIFWVIM